MLNNELFPADVPPRPMGHYAHIILLRETDSYSLFQTDGELNTAQVHAGISNPQIISRITMFKRKQTTPERLIGRELLRHYGFTSAEMSDKDSKTKRTDDRGVAIDGAGVPICDYNVDFCKQCPDCISYGFAIGDAGSEKSKVYSDTAYSISHFDTSHEAFTLNAPYEAGTMSRQGELTNRINEQDHVRPQTLFPSVTTIRDLSAPLFRYVLMNVLRARRYGAQTTRTGTMTNHLIGIVLADGEIFSNLHFTQRLYDALNADGHISDIDPISVDKALESARALVPQLLQEDRVMCGQTLLGDELDTFLNTLGGQMRDEQAMRALLQAAADSSRVYHARYVQKKGKKK